MLESLETSEHEAWIDDLAPGQRATYYRQEALLALFTGFANIGEAQFRVSGFCIEQLKQQGWMKLAGN